MNSRKLTILFDANPLVNGNKSGVGYYTQNLIQSIADNYPDDVELVGHYFSFLGRKDSIDLPKASNILYRRSRVIPGKILSITRKFGFQPPLEIFFRQRGDVALYTNFVSQPSLFNIPRFVAVHDLCYIDVPEYVSKKNRLFLQKFVKKSIKTSSRVITISESTKRSIQKHYGTPEDRFIITQIPPGKKENSNDFDLKTIGVEQNFILFVGTLEPRKNVINLVKAYEELPKILQDKYQLVLAGGIGWYMEETMEYIAKLQKQGLSILAPGYVSTECRAALYENSSLFVLPSHYEGFGMPVLEAMNYKLPTAISDIDVFHEVAGDASAFFDKDSPSSIANTINQILTDPPLQKDLMERGVARVAQYEWSKEASKIFDAVKEVNKGRSD